LNSFPDRIPANNSSRTLRASPPAHRFVATGCLRGIRSCGPKACRQNSLQLCCLDWTPPESLAASTPQVLRSFPPNPRAKREQTLPAGNRTSGLLVFAESHWKLSFVTTLAWRHFRNYSLATELRDNFLLLHMAYDGFKFYNGGASSHGYAKMLHRQF